MSTRTVKAAADVVAPVLDTPPDGAAASLPEPVPPVVPEAVTAAPTEPLHPSLLPDEYHGKAGSYVFDPATGKRTPVADAA